MRFPPILFALLLSVTACDRDKGTFVDTCEELIQKRLKAPSTYRRIGAPEVIQHSQTLSDSDFSVLVDAEEQIFKDFMRESRAEGTGWVQVSYFETRVEYDAANSSGSWYTEKASQHDLNWAVEVDGKTQTDWVLEQGRQALRQYEQYQRQQSWTR